MLRALLLLSLAFPLTGKTAAPDISTLQHLQLLERKAAELLPEVQKLEREFNAEQNSAKRSELEAALLKKKNSWRKVHNESVRIRSDYNMPPLASAQAARPTENTAPKARYSDPKPKFSSHYASEREYQAALTKNMDFARLPVSKGGMGLGNLEAAQWAAANMAKLSPETMEIFQDKYRFAVMFAQESPDEGGIGLKNSAAYDWAMAHAQQHSKGRLAEKVAEMRRENLASVQSWGKTCRNLYEKLYSEF